MNRPALFYSPERRLYIPNKGTVLPIKYICILLQATCGATAWYQIHRYRMPPNDKLMLAFRSDVTLINTLKDSVLYFKLNETHKDFNIHKGIAMVLNRNGTVNRKFHVEI